MVNRFEFGPGARRALSDVLGGSAASVLSVTFGLSYALLIFTGPLAPHLSYGVAATFIASGVIATGAVGRTPQPGGWHWKGCVAMTGSRTCSIHLDASPGAAFALMRDPGCYDEFMPGVRFTPRAITQGGVGTTFDFETRVAGVPFHGAGTFHGAEVAAAWTDRFRVLMPYHPGFGESGDDDGLRDRLMTYVAKWEVLKPRRVDQLLPARQLQQMLRAAGAPARPEDIGLTAAQVALQNSPPHRTNMLGNWTEMGVGISRGPDGIVWVAQTFVRRPTPTNQQATSAFTSVTPPVVYESVGREARHDAAIGSHAAHEGRGRVGGGAPHGGRAARQRPSEDPEPLGKPITPLHSSSRSPSGPRRSRS